MLVGRLGGVGLGKREQHKPVGKKVVSKTHRFPEFIEKWNPQVFKGTGIILTTFTVACFYHFEHSWIPYTVSAFVFAYWYYGFRDMRQTSHAIQRNFPVLGNVRYFFESLRPEIRQYFIEDDDEAVPFSRESRSLVYQRAKNMTDTVPLGTRMNVYEEGYEYVNHSIWPTQVNPENLRVTIGGPECTQPYSASLFNVSAMSYGALSDNAILSLNGGAKLGNFYHNTGEGGISSFHKAPGGDIVWNIGTGYFGCRNANGQFSEEKFKENALLPQVKMIEVKLSQVLLFLTTR